MNDYKSDFYDRIRKEIKPEYERMLLASAVISTDALVDAVVHKHMGVIYQMPNADDAALFAGALHSATWDAARDYMNKIGRQLDDAAAQEKRGQMRFVGGGFECDILQDNYAILRKGVRVHCPLELMTDDEIIAKAEEHYSMAKGHTKHGDRLIAYLDWRAAHKSGLNNQAVKKSTA